MFFWPVSNLVIAAGLVILAAAHGIAGLVIAWTVLGIGIGMGLYDPAFAALTWLYGREARSSITGITLIAGFASTIGWPMSAVFLHEFGWRAACLIWAGLNILLAAPVNWLSIPRHGASGRAGAGRTELPAAEPPRGAMPILAFFFCRHLVRAGSDGGASAGLAAGGGCIVDRGNRRCGAGRSGSGRRPPRRIRAVARVPPNFSARIASVLHPIGAAFIALFGVPGIVAFALLHGAGNGMITIAKGTLPLALFGPQGYGLRSGLLSAPARTLQSAAPFLFGMLLDRVGIGALGLSAGLCLAAFGSLFLLRPRGAVAARPSPRSC